MKKLLTIFAGLLLLGGIAWADTTTTRWSLTKPDVGSTNWGPKINTNYDTIDNAAGLAINNTYTASNFFTAITTFSAQLEAGDGSAGTPTYGFSGQTNRGVFGATNLLGFAVGGSTVAFLNTSGLSLQAGYQFFNLATSNQFVIGTTLTDTLSFTAPTVSRTLTVPDPGANASFVLTQGTQTITGPKTFASSTTFSSTGFFSGALTVGGNTTSDSNFGTISSVGLNKYYDGSFNVTFTGAFNSGAQTVFYTRVGGIVTLHIPFFLATASSASTLATGTSAIPSGLRPGTSADYAANTKDNGTVSASAGSCIVGSDGNIVIYKDFAHASFTGSGSTGLNDDLYVTYLVGR